MIELDPTRLPAAGAPAIRSNAMRRGIRSSARRAARGKLYDKYLKVVDLRACGEEMHHHRADDAPPYFTIFIVGHIIVGGVLALEQTMRPKRGCISSCGYR